VTTINRNPHLVGQIALSEGLVTAEILEECIQIQAAGPSGRALGEIMVEKGYLSLEQLDWVIGIQRTRFQRMSADPARGGLFGQIAVRLGFLSQDQLHESLREQQDGAAAGSSLLLGQILLRKNYLTVDQFLEILHRQNKEVARCPKCGAFYDVHGRHVGTKFVCSKCNAVIP